jgi:FAD/FMN-containing dehydrogenase
MNAPLDEMKTRLHGDAVGPGDAAYEEARRIWNGTIDKKPALIVRCGGVADVIEAVNYARDAGLAVSIRGGGHHVAGGSVNDGGLVIDLSGMSSVRAEPWTKRVRAEGGALLADLDREAQAFGLAVPSGLVSETGIGGLTLAGGLGWLRRKHGYTADNLISADVVTADGKLVRASAEENADLFWALRGGGWDMGVVTSFEFQAYDLGPETWVTFVAYPWREAAQVLRNFDAYGRTAPDEVGVLTVCWTFPSADPFPREVWGEPFVLVIGPYGGPAEEGQRVTRPLHELGTPVIDLSEAMPYRLAQKQLFDEDYPNGLRYYWKSVYLRGLEDGAIDVLLDQTLKRPSPISSLDVWLLGGALSRVPPEATALSHRNAPYLIGIEANWSEPADDAANIAWSRAVADELAPFSTGGSYLNFEDLGETKAVAASHGSNYERLVSIKRKYDPNNLFRSRRGLVD